MTTISFQELVPGSEGVRITEDNLLWAVDLTMVVTGKNRDEAGGALRRLTDDIFESSKMLETHLAANGGKKTKLVTFDHALELVMVLPGKMAKEFRVKACDILKRYFAGDKSLVREIEANAALDAPINQLARASLKRDREELEYQEHVLSIRNKELELQQNIMKVYQSLCPGGVIDDRANIMFKDKVLNLMGSRPSIGNGADPEGDPMSVSDMITTMGKHFKTGDSKKIGLLVAAKFRDRYGPDAKPGKHQQWVEGRKTEVNHYVAKDHDILRDVIGGYVKQA